MKAQGTITDGNRASESKVALCDALVQALKELNVKFVFGISGANIEHFHDAINRLGEGQVKAILAKHESSAAMMADCHARVHRTLGVCCATSGGGMVNLLSGIAESYADSNPVLGIIGQPPLALDGAGAFQDSSGKNNTINAEKMWAAVTKYTKKLYSAEDFWPALTEAVLASLSGRLGPSVLLIPRNLFECKVDACSSTWASEIWRKTKSPSASKAQLEDLWRTLKSSKQPVLIVGKEAGCSKRRDAIIKFATLNKIPTATTMSAAGGFPNHYSHYLGTIGAAGNPSAHDWINNKADLVLAFGTGLRIMTRGPIEKALSEKEFVLVNTHDNLCKHLGSHKSIKADPGEVAAQLLEYGALENRGCFEPELKRSYFQPTLAPKTHAKSAKESGELLQSEALMALNQFLPKNGHIVFDAGNCAATGLHFAEIPENCTATIALGMGGMGYALPGAIGAQLGSPKGCRTFALVGDGAFLAQGFEIHTATELNLPILFIVFNNGCHGMCVIRQQLYFEGRIESTTFGSANFSKIAKGIAGKKGIWAQRVKTLPELESGLNQYLALQDGPGVLEILIGEEEMPPFAPFLPADAAISTSNKITPKGGKKSEGGDV